jgi:GTPase SAR1 family protein
MTRTPQIALIGTEGSGKTVLTTVLANKLSQATSNGLCMIPIGAETAKYIEFAWATLQSGEWVPSTPAGKLFALHWNLKIGNQQAEMKLIDSAGQDLRKLFGNEAYQDPNLPEQDKLLIKYIRSSSILIILINLRDFIAETNIGRKIESQMSLKEALEFINKYCNKQVAVVLPQYDEYQTIIQQQYGSDNAFIQQELPYLYNSQASNWKENLFPVAAVNDTEIRNDRDGRTRKAPKPGFGSAGLDQLIQWLGDALQTDLQHIEAERQIEEARQLEAERQRQMEAEEIEKRRQWAEFEKKIVQFFKGAAVVGVILFALWIGGGIISGIKGCVRDITPCSVCGGRGQIVEMCSKCGGGGRVVEACSACGGNGTVRCSTCNGSGKGNIIGWFQCSSCSGAGSFRCSQCNGSGKSTGKCSQCNSLGKFTYTCSQCNGSGKMYNGK